MLNETSTYKEIRQQPKIWKETEGIVASSKQEFVDFVNKVNEHADGKPVKVYFTGAGSSAYVGDILRLAKSNKFSEGWDFENVSTTHFVTNPLSFIEEGTVYVFVSFARSGNSPETKGTIEIADQLADKAFHIFITNNKDGFLGTYENDNIFKIILPEETNDKSLAMTSSFSSMLLSAYLLFGGEVSNDFYDKAEKSFDSIDELADKISGYDYKKVFYVGTGIIGELTREVALKLNELTSGQIGISRETTLGFRHGPKAGLSKESIFILLRSNHSYRRQYEKDLIKEIESGNPDYQILILWPNNDDSNQAVALNNAEDFNDFELALTYLIFGQLLASKQSIKFGLNPDNPSPTGFINRVVKGVTIYDFEQ